MASKDFYILQSGCVHEGYTVVALCDGLLGAQKFTALNAYMDYRIDRVPVNGKPRQCWEYNRETGEWEPGTIA